MHTIRSCLSAVVVAVTLALVSIPAGAVSFNQINLVTDDQAANSAKIADPDLKNAWGMTAAPGADFWISANGSGKALLYKVDPVTQVTTRDNPTISIPGNGSITSQAGSSGANFAPDNTPSNYYTTGQYLFVSEDGIISSWTYGYIYIYKESRGLRGSTARVPAERDLQYTACHCRPGDRKLQGCCLR